MVMAYMVSLCPSIPHDVGLEALRRMLDDRVNIKIDTKDLLKMPEFALKNNYFDFSGKVKLKLSGTFFEYTLAGSRLVSLLKLL